MWPMIVILNTDKMKKLGYTAVLLLSLSMMSSCDYRQNNGNHAREAKTNAYNEATQEEEAWEDEIIDPSELYSEWWECIDVKISTNGFGQDVYVQNICDYKIKKVKITVYCDGRSMNLTYYDINPGNKERQTVPVVYDADLEVIDIGVEFETVRKTAKKSYSSTTPVTNDYSWIVGTWVCDMGQLGTVAVRFEGNGVSGDCCELQYGSFLYGTYRVSNNELTYTLDGSNITTSIDIEPGHRLAAGGGYYYHKTSSSPSVSETPSFEQSPKQQTQDAPTEVIKGGLNDLMGVDASNCRFTESDLSLLSAKELTYLRNQIYAKHGYVFKSQELNTYFKQFNWYHPDPNVTAAVLNDTEKANAEFIKRYQEQNGKTYKPQ